MSVPAVEQRRASGGKRSPSSPKAENRTDLGNARRLVRHFGERIRYVHAWKKWLVYGNGRWQVDDSGELERLGKEMVVRIYSEALAASNDTDRQALAKWAANSESVSAIRAAVELARSEPGIPVRPQELDADPWLLNVTNGTLELRTGQLREHRPADLITKQCPVAYDPAGRCPQWDRFLRRVLDNNDELLRFLQRAVGYSLTGSTSEQVLFFLYGKGNNGKSKFLEVLGALLGDYGHAADFSTFLERRSEGPRNDVARLQGARFVTAIETGDGRRLAEGLVKQLTGGDVITARFLHAEHFEFRAQFKLFLAANHKPTIRGTDHAIWRRIRLIPFTVTIPEEERDPEIAAKLKAELPGVLVWAVQGASAWQEERLGAPLAVRNATEAYRSEMDVLGGFLDECCELGASLRAAATLLYQAYRKWCDQGGERAVNQRDFGAALGEREFHRVKSSGIYWYGLRLLNPGEEREEREVRDHSTGNLPYSASRGETPERGSIPPAPPVPLLEPLADVWEPPKGGTDPDCSEPKAAT